MPAPRDRVSLIKAARMYFVDGRSQDDIARVLGTSRSNVSRMLTAARDQGIVEIRVHDQVVRDPELEHGLRERFGLSQVRVAAFNPGADVRTATGELAAQWLDETLQDGQTLALSWGTTLQAVVEAVSVDQPRSVEVVPLIGGLSATTSLMTGQELVRELAGRLGGTYRYLHGPALLQSEAARNALLAEPSITSAFDRAQSADLALVGIGAVDTGSSTQILDGLGLTPAQRKAFLTAGPVGDACCRFFDADGHQITGVVHDRVLAVDLRDLRRIPTVMGVATGAEKAAAVLGAIRGRIINSLTTDASLAQAVLTADTEAR
jgi:DNA-binding transcriptional regulator LsrR (DeoR family)